jgi:hypothetical protein
MSLHQPGPSLFAMLDQALLLAQGRAVYHGSPAGAPAAFERLGAPVPADSTIAEHMLFAVSDEGLWPSISERLLRVEGAGEEGREGGAAADGSAASEPLHVARPRPGLLRELAVVFWRSSADVVRNPLLGTFHALIGLVSGLLVGCIFFRVGVEGRLGGGLEGAGGSGWGGGGSRRGSHCCRRGCAAAGRRAAGG